MQQECLECPFEHPELPPSISKPDSKNIASPVTGSETMEKIMFLTLNSICNEQQATVEKERRLRLQGLQIISASRERMEPVAFKHLARMLRRQTYSMWRDMLGRWRLTASK